MKLSTIVTLLIGLVVGVLLTSALSTAGRGFSLQLCPTLPWRPTPRGQRETFKAT
jgi:hypothetical protein